MCAGMMGEPRSLGVGKISRGLAVYRADTNLISGPGWHSFSASAPVSNLHATQVALDL